MTRDHLVFRLLYRHISTWQMLGFALANLCGMTIVVAAIQFATDVIPLFSGSDSFMREGQVVVTKRVSAFGSLSGAAPTFTESEIADLRRQPFVKGVGLFRPSQYGVYATIGSRRLGMEFSTQMFFESLPDEYVDVDRSQWTYTPGSDTVPIILPQNYLNLYNFGFAASQGLPAISEGIVKQVGIRLTLSGETGHRLMTGRVVAFSKSINTILVPETFMDEANRLLSPSRMSPPSRIAVMASNSADDRLADYIDSHGYDTEGNDIDSAKTASFLRLTTTIVVAIGLVICALAFYVLALSIFLLLQKHTEQIDNLLLIGYSPTLVARPFYIMAIAINTFVTLSAVVTAMCLRGFYLPKFGELYPSMTPAAILPAVATALSLFMLMASLNYATIRRKIFTIWDTHKSK